MSEEAPPYSVEDADEELFFPHPVIEEMLSSLHRKCNVVLQGPPGVGKSFAARRLAYAHIGRKAERQVCMVQFQPVIRLRGLRSRTQASRIGRICETRRHLPPILQSARKG